MTTYDATVNPDVHTLMPKLSRILPDRADGQVVVALLFQGCLKFDEFNRYILERLESLCLFLLKKGSNKFCELNIFLKSIFLIAISWQPDLVLDLWYFKRWIRPQIKNSKVKGLCHQVSKRLKKNRIWGGFSRPLFKIK